MEWISGRAPRYVASPPARSPVKPMAHTPEPHPDCWLYSAAQCRQLDRLAGALPGISEAMLMERAGAAVFALLRQRWPQAFRILVLCGTGNNGGDGFVVARLAQEAGLAVKVLQLGDEDRIGGAARAALDALLAWASTSTALTARSSGGFSPASGVGSLRPIASRMSEPAVRSISH